MWSAGFIGFLAVAGVAAYAQTLTGFAFGLLVMGIAGLTGLMGLPDAAVIVSILVLINAAQVLAKGWRDVAQREFALVLATSLPMQPVGYWLLAWLASENIHWLRIVLGGVIIVSALQLIGRPAPLPQRSRPASFLFYGGIAGLMGGLFSTSGPPLVFHLYRQPFPMTQIRATLVSVFALNAGLRLVIAAGSGGVTTSNLWTAFFAAPAVIGATMAARRWPPRVSQVAMRRVVFGLLLLSGFSLAIPSLWRVIGSNASVVESFRSIT
jgi:uncharacterized membrane protein YfcA